MKKTCPSFYGKKKHMDLLANPIHEELGDSPSSPAYVVGKQSFYMVTKAR